MIDLKNATNQSSGLNKDERKRWILIEKLASLCSRW
jgi:hypothetical protein